MKRKTGRQELPDRFIISDGSLNFDGEYGTGDYLNFVSNGMTNNERIDAVDYFDEFLKEDTKDDQLH